MKVENEIMEKLKVLLAEELAAIELYILHTEICENCGFTVMGDVIKKHAINEMSSTQKLIKRILDNEGTSYSENGFPVFNNMEMDYQYQNFCATEEGP